MSAQLRVIQGDHKVNIWNMTRRYRAKLIRINGGFPEYIDYIGEWLGWKKIDADLSAVQWSVSK